MKISETTLKIFMVKKYRKDIFDQILENEIDNKGNQPINNEQKELLKEKMPEFDKSEIGRCKEYLENLENVDGVISILDDEFPILPISYKIHKCAILFYKGNIDLLKEREKNIAVIGHTKPSEKVVTREEKIVDKLNEKKYTIVSGLANGCDEVSHRRTLENRGNTIAILPSTLGNIMPKGNQNLADEIIKNNGLLLSEYHEEITSKYELIKRYVDRDRLQALFSKAVFLIASFRKDEGDSGSRHAVDFALKNNIEVKVMLDETTQKILESSEKSEHNEEHAQFGLNYDYHIKKNLKIITNSEIDKL